MTSKRALAPVQRLTAPGVIGLETLLPVSLELVHKRATDLVALFQKLALAPARLLGLPQGRLAPGAPADLVLFDPDRAWAAMMNSFSATPVGGRVGRGDRGSGGVERAGSTGAAAPP